MREVYSRYLHNYLHKLINTLPANQRLQLKTLQTCGTKIIPSTIADSGVFLLSNGEQAKMFGMMSCKNSWACPVCTARKMEKLSSEISAAIPIMQKKGYFGLMITFTIPHVARMSCRETLEILYSTMKRFRQSAKAKLKSKNCKGNIVHQFFDELQIKHFIQVCEFTHGKNGWHPHFHCIFWCKRGKQHNALKYQKPINDWWLVQSRHFTKQYWLEHNLHVTDEKWADIVLDKLYGRCQKDASFVIGTKDGKVEEAHDGNYLAGWGANDELTGLEHKTANAGHHSPHQLLQMAYEGDKKAEKLYIEFCLAVTQKPVKVRIHISQTGLRPILNQARQVAAAEEFLLKKKELPTWQVVLWFSSDDWSYILDLERNSPVIANILYLGARHYELLLQYLEFLHIPYKLPSQNIITDHIQNIMNQCA